MLWATASGPIATPDSMSYLGAAQSLVARGELRIPVAEWIADDSTTTLQQFPPAYPVAIAAGIVAGASTLDAARLVAAIAALIGVASLTWVVARSCGNAAGALVPLLLLSVRGVPTVYLTALSEPLFLAALAVTLMLMASAPDRPWTYGATAAAGNMVRYAGVSMVAAAAVWALLWAMTSARQAGRSASARVCLGGRAAVLAALPGAAFNVAWLIRARRAELDTPVTTVAWMGRVGATLAEGGRTLVEHLVPTAVPWSWRLVGALNVAALAIALLVTAWRDSRGGAEAAARRLGVVSAVTGGCYAIVLLYSRLFVGATIPFDDRILGPLLVCAVLALAAAASIVWRNTLPRWRAPARRAVVMLTGLWLVASAVQSLRGALAVASTPGGNYESAYWQATLTAIWLRDQGRRHALFTNDPVATYFVTGRPSRELPEALDADTVRAFGETLEDADGVIVEYAIPFLPMADAGRLARALGLCPVVRSRGGTVWVSPPDTARGC